MLLADQARRRTATCVKWRRLHRWTTTGASLGPPHAASHDSSIVLVNHARMQMGMWYTKLKVAAGYYCEEVEL